MRSLTIRAVDPAPSSHLDSDFQAVCRLISEYNHELVGGPQWDTDPEADLAGVLADTQHLRMRWLAEAGGEVVGYANLRINAIDDPDAANVFVFVLPKYRGQGIGAALARVLRTEVRAQGLSRVESWTMMPASSGEEVRPSSGIGGVPAEYPGARLALREGMKLAQVERVSRYEFARPLVSLEQALSEAKAHAGEDYEVFAWEGMSIPEDRDDLAVLKERMNADVPLGELVPFEAKWDAERIRDTDEKTLIGKRFYRAAVRHVPSGAIVALTELARDRNNPHAFVDQWETVVLPEHRGRRLGMLVKAANLIQVRDAEPTAEAVITWNAEENRHMLAVNEALGFEEFLRRGLFTKDVE